MFFNVLALILSKASHIPTLTTTTARVHLGEGPKITLIELSTAGETLGIDEKTFIKFAEHAKIRCPVSQALAAVDKHLAARLT